MTLSELMSFGVTLLSINQYEIGSPWSYILVTLAVLLCMIPSYLLGSVNFAIVISRLKYKEDIRSYGSGNAGTTNMLRTYGKGAAAMTLAGDMLKSVVSCILGYLLLGVEGAYLAGFFCVLGHMFPVFYKFKGGKGVATTAAMILMCNPPVFGILLLLFIIIVVGTKYISLGSVMCMLLYPLLLHRIDTWLDPQNGGGLYVVLTVLLAGLVVFMHRENIKRLMNKTESKISFSKITKKLKGDDDNTPKAQ